MSMRFIQGILMSAGVICLLAAPRAIGAGTPISPYLIGENLWDGDTPGQGADRTWGRMKAASFRLIRIGGIEYNNKTPSVERYSRWIDSIRSIGAEPLIQVSTVDPASVAADLVTSLNVNLKYKVKFWAIGNEPTCGQTVNAGIIAGIAAKIKERASAMKQVDPSIRIFAGDECYWNETLYDGLIGGAQDITGQDPAGNWYVDIVSFHSYPFPGADQNAIYTRQQVLQNGIPGLRGMIQKCATAAASANAKHARTGNAALACAVTEFNITYWNSSDNSPAGVGASSFLNGQFMAEIFGSGMEFGAFTVAPWSMQQSGGDGSGDDLGLFDGSVPVVPRPSYYHIKMIAQNMHGGFLTSAVDKLAADKIPLKAYAALDQDTAAVLVLNENTDQGYRFTVDFTKSGATSVNPVGIHIQPGWEGSLSDSIPPQATVLLKFHKAGPKAIREIYTLGMAQKFQPPTDSEIGVATGIRLGGALAHETGAFAVTFRHGELSGDLPEPASYEVSLLGLDGTILIRNAGWGKSWNLALTGCRPGAYFLLLRTKDRTQDRARKDGPDRIRKIVLLNPA